MTVQTGAGKAESYSGDYKAAGRRGEEIVLNWLRSHPRIADVQDLSTDWYWREQDVDARIVWRDSAREEMVEIKSDNHARVGGNILIELLRLHHRTDALARAAETGWSLRSPAEWLFVWCPATSCILYCRLPDLRAWFQQWSYANLAKMEQKWIRTDSHKSTLIALVPWAAAGHLFRCAKISPTYNEKGNEKH